MVRLRRRSSCCRRSLSPAPAPPYQLAGFLQLSRLCVAYALTCTSQGRPRQLLVRPRCPRAAVVPVQLPVCHSGAQQRWAQQAVLATKVCGRRRSPPPLSAAPLRQAALCKGVHRSAPAATWADLPPPLWEAVAAHLPVPDLLSLRQAWRGASQLADQRARMAAVGALALELRDCVSAAYSAAYAAATDGYATMLDEGGDVSLDFLFGFLEGRAAGEGFQLVDRTELLPDWPGMRCTYQRQAPRANVAMQARSGELGWVPAGWLCSTARRRCHCAQAACTAKRASYSSRQALPVLKA